MITTKHNQLTIYPLSEKAVTIEFGAVIDEALMQRIHGFNRFIHEQPFPGLYDTVPAYTTLTVFYDPVIVSAADGMAGNTCFEKVAGYLRQLKEPAVSKTFDGELIDIPVCYGDAFGPDLGFVAEYHQLSIEQVISLHCSAVYRVYMIGFIPGFAYMGGLPAQLETPRKPVPSKAVPAGAVGIAGKQTGIYPLETPGGWQIIGQTPVRLFDASRKQPSLLKAGDRVKFVPVSIADFKNLKQA